MGFLFCLQGLGQHHSKDLRNVSSTDVRPLVALQWTRWPSFTAKQRGSWLRGLLLLSPIIFPRSCHPDRVMGQPFEVVEAQFGDPWENGWCLRMQTVHPNSTTSKVLHLQWAEYTESGRFWKAMVRESSLWTNLQAVHLLIHLLWSRNQWRLEYIWSYGWWWVAWLVHQGLERRVWKRKDREARGRGLWLDLRGTKGEDLCITW